MSVNRQISQNARTMPQLNAANNIESEHVCNNYPPIKHIPFPPLASHTQSHLINEWLLFAFSFWAAGLQFLHLYRTVWWLPDSFTHQTMVWPVDYFREIFRLKYFVFQNFYLIDQFLAIFLFLLLGRRFWYCLVIKCVDLISPRKFSHYIKKIVK